MILTLTVVDYSCVIIAIKGNTNIVKVLMKYTETPNAEDDAGRTPLKLAKRLGHDELINILQNFTI